MKRIKRTNRLAWLGWFSPRLTSWGTSLFFRAKPSFDGLRPAGWRAAVSLVLVLCIALTSVAGLILTIIGDAHAASITLVRSAVGINSGTTISVSLGAAPANGNALIAVIADKGKLAADGVTSITQTGVSWTRAIQAINGSGATVEVWYALNVSGAASSLSITTGSGGGSSSAVVAEYSGIATVAALDQTASNTGSGTTAATGTTATTTAADELWVAGFGSATNATFSAPTNSFSFVNVVSVGGSASARQATGMTHNIVTATGAASTGVALNSGFWAAAVVTFKAVPPGPTYTQTGYRAFANADSTNVGSPLAAANTPVTLNASGDAFRLRMLSKVGTMDLAKNGQNFKLQFADKGAAATCPLVASAGYADVAPAGWTPETSGRWNGRSYFGAAVFNNKLWVLGGYDGSGYKNDVWSSSDGVTWIQETAAAGWSARQTISTAVFNNKLWVLGGYDGANKNDVWSSSDGVTWTQETAAAGWSARQAFGSVVFNNKLWVIGGTGSTQYNDVWSSSDGVTWTQETTAAGWSARYNFGTAVFSNKLWVMGGNKNDVWSSSDGVTWTQETTAAGWSARQAFGLAVFNNKLWVIGGNDGVNKHDVWSSSDGVTWTQETTAAGWSARYAFTTTVFSGKLWVMGGNDSTYKNDAWSSSDGVGWGQAPQPLAWTGRQGFGSVAFDGKLWVLGGYDGSAYKNDVWSSSDGVTWTQVTSAAGWSARNSFGVVVFNNKLWVIGGFGGSYKNDVWSSSDGVTWTQVTSAAGWSARYNSGAVVFNNKIWVMGGQDGTAKNDVWSSSDGVTWTQETAAAGWSARYAFGMADFNNKLWVLGGYDGSAYKNDVWSSSDGVTWTQETAAAGWSGRSSFSAVAFSNTLWVLGGYDGSAYKNDVWSSSDGVTWTQVTSAAGWSARYNFGTTIFNNKLWMLGGRSGSAYKNDIWSFGNSPIAFNDNPTPVNGSPLTANANDPTNGTDTIVSQSYVENNNFANTAAAIAVGENGKWDFSLKDNGAPSGTTYCIRIVKADGTPLDTYSVFPEITTAPPPIGQTGYRWFGDADGTSAFAKSGPTNINDPSNFGTMTRSGRQVVRRSDGALFAVLSKAGSCQVWGSTDGQSWTQFDAANSPATCTGMAAAIDSNDVIHIVYINTTTIRVRYCTMNVSDKQSSSLSGFTFSASEDVTTAADVTQLSADIAVDSNNKPHVAAVKQGTFSSVFYFNKVGASWTNVEIKGNTSQRSALMPSIAISEDNIPQISLINMTDGYMTAALGNANAATSFILQDVDLNAQSAAGVGNSSIGIDSSGNTWITYVDKTTNYVKLVKHNKADSWSTWQSVVTDSKVGYEPTLAIGGSSAVVFYENSAHNAVYDVYNGSGWSGETILQTGTFQDVKVKQASYFNNQSAGIANFNGSLGISDPNGVWSNTANAFDSDPATGATSSANGSKTLNYLEGDGVASSTLNQKGSITSVYVRNRGVNGTLGTNPTSATYYTESAEELGTSQSNGGTTNGAAYSDWVKLTVPVGGWTWDKLSKLRVRYWTGTNDGTQALHAQVKVYSTDPGAFDYLYSDGTDIYWASLNTGPTPTDVGAPLATQNNAYTMVTTGQGIRLRALLTPSGGSVKSGAGSFKLQYVDKGTGTCAAPSSGTPAAYTDVTGSTALAYRSVTGAANGAALTPNANDPFRSGVTVIPQVFASSNPFANIATIAAGSDGMWDFALKDNAAPSGKTYCVRVVQANGNALNGYSVYPEVTTYNSASSVPNQPVSLGQAKGLGGAAISTGGWANTTTIDFSALMSSPSASDTLQLCVEVKPIAAAFTNTDTACSSGVAYSGSAVSGTINLALPENEYHWQARVKSAGGAYSTWVSYGGNAETGRDFGIDTTAPTGTVYDGSVTGIDAMFNNGSLTSLSANWNINAAISGLSGYEYSVGTTVGGTDILNWTSAGTSTSATASPVTLTTSKTYFFNVRVTDNAGNVGVISSNGQMVAPTLTFATSSGSVDFATPSAANSYTSSQSLTVTTTTNAQNGYKVYGKATDFLKNSASQALGMFSGGTYAAPAAWGSNTGFGYNSSDTSVNGTNRFNSPTCPGGGAAPCFAPYSVTGIGDVIADGNGPVIGDTYTITNKVSINATAQQAGKYQTTVLYSAYATY